MLLVLHKLKINGFTEKYVDDYLVKTFENKPDGNKMALELQSQVHNNPEVMKILNVPINVAIIDLFNIFCLKLPDKITSYFVYVLYSDIPINALQM